MWAKGPLAHTAPPQLCRRKMISKNSITAEDATRILCACLDTARAVQRSVSIAIVDDAGVLLIFQREPGARAYTVDLALQKARTSALVGVPSATVSAKSGSDLSAGGIPLSVGGQYVGAIGVSGALPDEDVQIATAGADAFLRNLGKTRDCSK